MKIRLSSLFVFVTIITTFSVPEVHAMRWYSHATSRWLSRDPLGEFSFAQAFGEKEELNLKAVLRTINDLKVRVRFRKEMRQSIAIRLLKADRDLFIFCANGSVNTIDPLGLDNPGPGGQNESSCVSWPPEKLPPEGPYACSSRIYGEVAAIPALSGDPGLHYQHCLAACRITRECPGGAATARVMIFCQDVPQPDDDIDSIRDRSAGGEGVEYAGQVGSCADLCEDGFENGAY